MVMSQTDAEKLEQSKLDRDAAYSRHRSARIKLERAEKECRELLEELDLARMRMHDLQSASWADAVQAELALSKKQGEIAVMREERDEAAKSRAIWDVVHAVEELEDGEEDRRAQ